MNSKAGIDQPLTCTKAAVSDATTLGSNLSHVTGVAVGIAIARVKGLSKTERILLTISAFALGSAVIHRVYGEAAAKKFSSGMLAGPVQLAA